MSKSEHEPPEAWLETLDDHAREHGFHARLGDAHGALYTEDDESVLLVTFENAEVIRRADVPLPEGLKAAGREGWSQLCLYSEGRTWFRDPEVFAFIDDLVDDGFFDLFDRVVFLGAGAEGYAAAVFSVAAPGATVIAIRPQATLSPRLAGWDRRHLSARRLDFDNRYGYAPKMLDAAAEAFVIFDPEITEDAMHAALFGQAATLLPARFAGRRTERELERMGVLRPLVKDAAKGRISAQRFYAHWRKRKVHGPYLRNVLRKVRTEHGAMRMGLWARAATDVSDHSRFRKALREAEATLAEGEAALPDPLARAASKKKVNG